MFNEITASIWCAAVAVMFSIGAEASRKEKSYTYCFVFSILSLICSFISVMIIVSMIQGG